MNATMDLPKLLESPTWDAAAVNQVRQAAFGSSKQLEQFKAWALKTADQDDRAANLKAGVALFLLGANDRAIDLLKQASEGEVKRYYLGLALREAEQHDAAIAELERAEARGWDRLDVACQQADALRRAGRFDESAKLLNKLAKSGDGVAEYHYQRGCSLARLGQTEEAAAALERALELDPAHRGALFQLAYMFDSQGDQDEAIDLYRKCIQTSPAPISGLINLAVLFEDTSNYDLSVRCLQEVLRVDPNHPRARLYLKDALAGMTQFYDEAQERLRDKRTAVLEIPITDFELSVRSRNCLKKMNIHTLGDLLRVSEAELLSYKNFGETSLNEIKAVLTQKGLRLGQSIEEERAEARRAAANLAGVEIVEDVLAKSVDELELSVRSRRCLERLGLRTLGDVVSRTEAELMAAKNFGVTSLTEIKQQLERFSLTLRKLEE